jgi:hypothetical protein
VPYSKSPNSPNPTSIQDYIASVGRAGIIGESTAAFMISVKVGRIKNVILCGGQIWTQGVVNFSSPCKLIAPTTGRGNGVYLQWSPMITSEIVNVPDRPSKNRADVAVEALLPVVGPDRPPSK